MSFVQTAFGLGLGRLAPQRRALGSKMGQPHSEPARRKTQTGHHYRFTVLRWKRTPCRLPPGAGKPISSAHRFHGADRPEAERILAGATAAAGLRSWHSQPHYRDGGRTVENETLDSPCMLFRHDRTPHDLLGPLRPGRRYPEGNGVLLRVPSLLGAYIDGVGHLGKGSSLRGRLRGLLPSDRGALQGQG